MRKIICLWYHCQETTLVLSAQVGAFVWTGVSDRIFYFQETVVVSVVGKQWIMVSVVREHDMSDHGSDTAYIGESLRIFLVSICFTNIISS